MELLFIAVNSSYVHTNPAVRSLAGITGGGYCEYNINQHMQDVLSDIVRKRPQIAAFSCYIWNIGYVLRLAQDLKKIRPETIVWLGGPEASYDARRLMDAYPFLDVVFCGESEESVIEWISGRGEVEGVLYRRDGSLCGNDRYRLTQELDTLPEPFCNEDYDPNKIYYYESSRGCPFDCAYCLSGNRDRVRKKSLSVVTRDLNTMSERGVRLLKFTDRTFNADNMRAKEIVKIMLALPDDICFHLEVGLDLMDEEMLRLLKYAPAGRIQLEAGVQSCNPKTLEAVARKTDLSRLMRNAETIGQWGTVHLHLDLIAGLPHEDLRSFEASFNQVYSLYPDCLQLGFLKLLKGSVLRDHCEKYGVLYRDYPPYEVLQTDAISADDLFLLKEIEKLVNRYYNTGRARRAIDYLTKNGISAPFAYYKSLSDYCAENGYADRPLRAVDQFAVLAGHAGTFLSKEQEKEFLSRLRDDYRAAGVKGRMPPWLERE